MSVSTVIPLLLAAALLWIIIKQVAPAKGLLELPDREFAQTVMSAKKGYLIDVREPHEFQGGHITGAVNIPLSRLGEKWSSIPRDKELFLYCQSGMRSKRAAAILMRKGLGPVSHLRGGFSSWTGKRSQ